MKNIHKLILFFLIIAFIAAVTFLIKKENRNYAAGDSMLGIIRSQLEFGARNVGSAGRVKTQELIVESLNNDGAQVNEQSWRDESGQQLKNIIGRINPESNERIIIAAHYDTPEKSVLDKKNPNAIMPGANDGASGVAVLLELAKTIKPAQLPNNLGVDLVFFDAEEFNPGGFDDWAPKGSTYFSNDLRDFYPSKNPKEAINIDMVCDADLQLYKDPYSQKSAPKALDNLWEEGKKLDARAFRYDTKFEIKDDITPLIKAGIPSVLMIDFNYPYFHTSKDVIDNCSSKSLDTVYKTIKNYLQNYTGNK